MIVLAAAAFQEFLPAAAPPDRGRVLAASGTQGAAAEPSAAGPVAFDCPACTAAMCVAVGGVRSAKSDERIKDL